MSQRPANDTRPVAFFDFDGTLTTGDTLMPFLKFVVGTPTYYAKLALVSPVLAAYFAKLLRNDTAKQIVLKQYLAGYHIDDLFELGQRFSEDVIPTMLRPEGMERLRWHQDQGHVCVLVSASMDVYLQHFAKKHDLSGCLVSSFDVNNAGSVTGWISGENCHGREKVERIEKWLIGREPSFVSAYGDTEGDIYMLKKANAGWLLKDGVFSRI